ncbi:MAG: hypothetical protein H6677_00055 [Candidatus Obscuribacterales bacterium]|nr:hypothetical protein [Cyanobacteria bacterium HKST-UBA01]MCB9466631.1 hypothetical protein [Candidatus Obscuribacterales bacterium]
MVWDWAADSEVYNGFMLVPDIEKNSSKVCVGCGEILLPHVIICAGCKTVNRVDERGFWSDYNTLESEDGIVIKGLFRKGNQEALEIHEEALEADEEGFEHEHSLLEYTPAWKQLRFDYVRRIGSAILLLVLVFSLFCVFIH